jgi:hypothetical protein
LPERQCHCGQIASYALQSVAEENDKILATTAFIRPNKIDPSKCAAVTFAALRLLYDSFSFVTGKKGGTGNRR